jgi:DNA-binding NtrC family response regulator
MPFPEDPLRVPESRIGPPGFPVSAPDSPICAPDSPFAESLRLCAAVARRACPVLLRGESGTGKEVVARFLHSRSPRARGPFVPVNCGALPPGLIESELFGHVKGAFTGAASDQPGRFREAEGGTLFLDEIGDMPLEAQVRLLRALQEKRVRPVGGAREFPVDFRLVCATHRDLAALVRAGRFREDLLFRLDVLTVFLPPLRARPGDIPLLLRHFLASLLPPAAAEAAWTAVPPELARRPFAGNVRELRNLAERYCVYRELGSGWEAALAAAPPSGAGLPAGGPGTMAAEAAGGAPVPGAPPFAGRAPVSLALPSFPAGSASRPRASRVSDREILEALGACGHHRGRASGMLGITRRALQYRLAKMGRAGSG